MACLHCNQRIGRLRSLVDDKYCCDAHRKAGETASARASRDSRNILDYYEEYSTGEDAPKVTMVPEPLTRSSKDSSSNWILLLLVIAIGAGVVALVRGTEADSSASNRTSNASAGTIRDFIRTHATVRLQADFHSSMDTWVPPKRASRAGTSSGATWKQQNGFVRPGAFRVWEKSMDLTDYHLEFAGSIEHKAMSWTYRTIDANNFYGGRLVITRPGPLPEVQLVRYVNVSGDVVKRYATRLPLVVTNDSVFKVDVNLKGSEMSTSVNGVIVDSWTDERFSSGGVGFYAERDEVALLRYVQVTQKDDFIGRILAHFGMVHPTFFRPPV